MLYTLRYTDCHSTVQFVPQLSNYCASIQTTYDGQKAAEVIVNNVAVSDVLELHSRYPGATFQAASQFNCLEFISPSMLPEHGITVYAYDNTQGPACALACAAGTLYRNYFAPVFPTVAVAEELETNSGNKATAQVGQSREWQLNNLDLLEKVLENPQHNYWSVVNGYTFSIDERNLQELNKVLLSYRDQGRMDELRDLVKIGLQENVGVTFSSKWTVADADIRVNQCYCSALSCQYSGIRTEYWAALAQLILDAAYEATLWSAVINSYGQRMMEPTVTNEDDGFQMISREYSKPNRKEVFLTFVGGGVFGNDMRWIARAIGRGIAIVEKAGADLNVNLCHYRSVKEDIAAMIADECAAARSKKL